MPLRLRTEFLADMYRALAVEASAIVDYMSSTFCRLKVPFELKTLSRAIKYTGKVI